MTRPTLNLSTDPEDFPLFEESLIDPRSVFEQFEPEQVNNAYHYAANTLKNNFILQIFL
jgi:hypothetical protein